MKKEPEELIDFWFSDPVAKRWFRSTPQFDNELRQRYELLVNKAFAGELVDWKQTPQGSLALVILLDQLPLNIYRGKPQSFAGEAMAREVSSLAIENGWDRALTDRQKAFLYIPFMHSEDPADQERSVQLYRDAGLKDNLYWAEHHRRIVMRFGRFPHRNAILGRASTEDELAWLESDEAFRG